MDTVVVAEWVASARVGDMLSIDGFPYTMQLAARTGDLVTITFVPFDGKLR